ncbi:thiamine biosynthesis lipoprotein [Hathewaya proteolytica DSM 3090]|uniref:FAD:protein FMN transferase n=1 Tax=Hathewaya proteolytica DSM 3090 TaxID=1121331 RepID=A0A1M6RSS5_9CLOT|nr:FAD:protein FMN transferase [Hathewaya proteolytica]SHK35480.1 thiamine biosynthesis lipoprotein [Hathewaya proteolytica DSM 3090]
MKSKNKFLSGFILLAITMVLFIGCGENNKEYSKDDFIMGTIINLEYYGKNGDKAIDESIERLKAMENLMSLNIDSSSINKINNHAYNEDVKLTEEEEEVIKKAIYYGEISQGAFDISIRPVSKLWAIGTDKERIPKDSEIISGLAHVNYKNIVLDEKNKTVRFLDKGMELDFGGIAKGFAADELTKILKKYDIKHALINLGGNLFVYGGKEKGEPLNIGIQDPLKEQGTYAAIVRVKDKSVVTSGNYERYFEVGGKRYHHIIDPNTGYPSDNGIISSTIISDKSIDGDALSTATYVMGVEKSMKLINSMDGVEAIFITKDKKIYTTKGLDGSNFKVENKEYSYENEKGR